MEFPFKKFFSLSSSSTAGEAPPYYAPLLAGDYASAIPLLQQAIREEDGHAMGVMASLLAMGRGVEKDIEEAALWFRQAAVRGDVLGQTAFGLLLATGYGVAKDPQEGAYWLYKAATSGHRTAAECLGDLVLKDRSLVGKYFSMDDVRRLMRRLRKSSMTHRRGI